LKVKAEETFEKLVTVYQDALRHIPQNNNRNDHQKELPNFLYVSHDPVALC
jgi:hypothetical protein